MMDIVTIKCVDCGKDHNIKLCIDDLKKWQKGALIQNALPYLSSAERELIISGICGKCFDKIFSS